MEIDNRLAERHLLGSLTFADPKPSGPLSIKLNLDCEYAIDTLQSGYTADTESDATVTFTASARTLQFNIHNAYIEDDATGPESHGGLSEKVVLRGQDDATDYGISLVIVNTQSSAIAA